MNVIFGWDLIEQENPGVMIELYHDDWALNAKVERIIIAEASNPGEIGLMEMALNLLHAGFKRVWREQDDK